MQYALLVYETPDQYRRRENADAGAYWGAYAAYYDALTKADALRGGACLKEEASTVTTRSGAVAVKDGPYAETRESLGGLFLLDTRDLDTAIELAKECPSTQGGAVELRPIQALGEGNPGETLPAATHALLLHDDETRWEGMSEADYMKAIEPYMHYTAALQKAGAFAGGDPLMPSAMATTIRQAGHVIDGPYAETREQLGGYYLLHLPGADEDTVREWAARCPSSAYGHVEIRPIWPMN